MEVLQSFFTTGNTAATCKPQALPTSVSMNNILASKQISSLQDASLSALREISNELNIGTAKTKKELAQKIETAVKGKVSK
jgi:hypothetical protein